MVVFVEGRDGFQVLGFKHLVAIQAAYVVDPIASRHNLGPRVWARLHKWRLPYSKHAGGLVKPPKVLLKGLGGRVSLTHPVLAIENHGRMQAPHLRNQPHQVLLLDG